MDHRSAQQTLAAPLREAAAAKRPDGYDPAFPDGRIRSSHAGLFDDTLSDDLSATGGWEPPGPRQSISLPSLKKG